LPDAGLGFRHNHEAVGVECGAQGGNSASQYMPGTLLQDGMGAPRDTTETRLWYQKAVAIVADKTVSTVVSSGAPPGRRRVQAPWSVQASAPSHHTRCRRRAAARSPAVLRPSR